MRKDRSNVGWLIPLAVWAGVTAGLVLAWRRSRGHGPTKKLLPVWLARMANRMGPVVYDDPRLAMRVRLSRLIVLETAVAGAWLAIVRRRSVISALRSLIYLEGDPINLAVFRIVVFYQIYNACYFDFIARIASLPAGLQFPPLTGVPKRGKLARFAAWPAHAASPKWIAAAGKAMKYAALAGMLGFCSRTAAGAAAFLFLLVWGRLQWYGKVDHHHHLFWFALLLALSPCGDALSVDRLLFALRGWKAPLPGPRYGMPIGFSMLLMGVIYLFPGLWKICRSGLDWALSESPRMMLHREWRMYGDWLPNFRFDRHPFLYQGGSLAAMLFEISFVWMLPSRRTRTLAGFLGVGFHLATKATMNIEFETLRNCYVLFVDWAKLSRAVLGRGDNRDRPGSLAASREKRPIAFTAGVLLLIGNIWTGAMRMTDGWPLACYPQFDGLSEPDYRTLQITVTLPDGSERLMIADDYRGIFGNRWNNLLQRILQSNDHEEKRNQLQLVWQVLGRTEGCTGKFRK